MEGVAGEPSRTAGGLCPDTRLRLVWPPGQTCLEPTVLIPSRPPFLEGAQLAQEVRHCPMRMRLPQKVCHTRGKMTRREVSPSGQATSFHSLVERKPETPRPDVGLTPRPLPSPPSSSGRQPRLPSPAGAGARGEGGVSRLTGERARVRPAGRGVRAVAGVTAEPSHGGRSGLASGTGLPGGCAPPRAGPCPAPGPGSAFSASTTPSAEGRGEMRPPQTFPQGLRPGRSAVSARAGEACAHESRGRWGKVFVSADWAVITRPCKDTVPPTGPSLPLDSRVSPECQAQDSVATEGTSPRALLCL